MEANHFLVLLSDVAQKTQKLSLFVLRELIHMARENARYAFLCERSR